MRSNAIRRAMALRARTTTSSASTDNEVVRALRSGDRANDAHHPSSRASTTTFEEEIIPGLRAFYAAHGHVCVPRSYVVPETCEDARARGVKLGAVVDRMRNRGDFVRGRDERVRALDDVGKATNEPFAWDVDDWIFYKQIIPCLRWFYKAYGHTNVPYGFHTPSDAEAYASGNDLKTYNRGFHIGQRVNDIRAKGTYVTARPDRFDALSKIAFVWDDDDYIWREVTTYALTMFKRAHGHLDVPEDFILGSSIVNVVSERWKPSFSIQHYAQGYALGRAVAVIRHTRFRGITDQATAQARLRRLDRMGFIWNHSMYRFKDVFLPALRLYVSKFGHVDVPDHFVITKDINFAPFEMPPETLNFKLWDALQQFAYRPKNSRRNPFKKGLDSKRSCEEIRNAIVSGLDSHRTVAKEFKGSEPSQEQLEKTRYVLALLDDFIAGKVIDSPDSNGALEAGDDGDGNDGDGDAHAI